MATIIQIENKNVKGITTLIIIGALGFYLGVALAEATRATVNKCAFGMEPNGDLSLKEAWITVFVAILIIVIFVYIMVKIYPCF